MTPDKLNEYEARMALEESLESDHYYAEGRTFCWYCGEVLVTTNEPTGADNECSTASQGPVCPSCSQHWERAYSSCCPECQQDGEDARFAGGFVHLNAPLNVLVTVPAAEGGNARVRWAIGTAACDACARPWIYTWTYRKDDPEEPYLYLSGPRSRTHGHRLANLPKRAREVVHAET